MQNAREQMTQGADVTRWFGSLDDKLSLDEYNFEHFRAKHLLSDARATIEERGIRPGPTHQVYGGQADPTYLIDRDGQVAFYVMWTHAPTLYRAIEQLMRQGGRGVAGGGVDRTPHILPAMTDGWNGLRRGLPQSLIDMETAAPTTGVGAWLGHQLRPLLAPLTLRAEPLPPAAKAGLALGAVALVVLGAQAFKRDSRRDDWKRSLGRLWR
jgi:hypothetical protein